MDTYLDIKMGNHKLHSDSSSSDDNVTKYYKTLVVKQKGGDPDNVNDILKHRATGSFPPLYKTTKTNINKDEEPDKLRSFANLNKTAVSIKEIMQERRNDDIKPFFT